MSVEDFRINAYVRQILSKSWVDIDALRYGAVGRVVYFHGRFSRMRPAEKTVGDAWSGVRPEQIAENLHLLELVEKEVRRESTVTDVVFRLDNFRKVNGSWESTGV
jgi:hypothetical protein